MSLYYLMSQLPSLDGLGEATPIPITEKSFYKLCGELLDKKLLKVLNSLTLIPPKDEEKTGFALVDSWNESERQLRLALAYIRAEKMKKPFETGVRNFPPEISTAAKTAAEMDNPLAAERYLSEFRQDALEKLRPMDSFSAEALFYYGLKLKLMLKIRQFDKDSGSTAYRNIYNSIMSGEMSEAVQ